MPGWMGTILRVDLSTRRISEEPLDPKAAKDYIGGRGLGIHYLNREVSPQVEALSPANKLMMLTGPLTGSGAPTGARYMVMTKSPLTGALTCSNSGGQFPTALKRAGYDGVIFEGRSPTPTYLWIGRGKPELRVGEHLWGKDCHETTDLLQSETDPKARIACIGQAGENQALFSAIINENGRAAGRSGVGAVMGSKNLKAVAVAGGKRIGLSDPEEFKRLRKEILDRFKAEAKQNPPVLRLHGTSYVVMVSNSYGALPTKNWQQGEFENWVDIHGETLTEKYLTGNKACFSCPIGCGRLTQVQEAPWQSKGEGPEYETIYAMGSNCGISDLAAIVKASHLCNQYGLDTISMGATLACAMELYELGLINEAEAGMPLTWGNAEALVEMTKATALGTGFGRMLAMGSKRLAAHYGRPDLAMVVKGQEPPGYEPRAEQGMGLAYATSPIGASHMRGDPAYFELFGVPEKLDPLTWRDKAAHVARWQDLSAIIDSAGLCIFFAARNLIRPKLSAEPEGILQLLNAATGAGYTLQDLMAAGERIMNAERIWLNRAGFTRAEDTLPKRLLQDPSPSGPAKGMVCHLGEMLTDYYQARGWGEDGRVSEAKRKELGL